jgi:hypothetical protein
MECPPGTFDKQSWLQARKVFVGGVPQNVNQTALHSMFNQVGKVHQAWLQSLKPEVQKGLPPPPAKSHRGFGFVVFFEKQTVDQLLGHEFSRYIQFGDIRLEVKRAVCKSHDPPPSPLTPKVASMPMTPQTAQGFSPNTWRNESPQSLQANSARLDTYANMSPTSSSISMEPAPGQWQESTPPPWMAPLMDPSRSDAATAVIDAILSGQNRDSQELAWMLEQAMPDYYDD